MRAFFLITFEYLGFIVFDDYPFDEEEVERVLGILRNIGRGILVLIVITAERELSAWLFPV